MAKPTQIAALRTGNIRQDDVHVPCIEADPLPDGGTEVIFTIDGITFRGTVSHHAEHRGKPVAVFLGGLTEA